MIFEVNNTVSISFDKIINSSLFLYSMHYYSFFLNSIIVLCEYILPCSKKMIRHYVYAPLLALFWQYLLENLQATLCLCPFHTVRR